jgi:hypothetical protein
VNTSELRRATERPSTIRRLRALDAIVLRDLNGVRHRLAAGEYHIAEDGDQMVIFEREREDAPCGRVPAHEFWSLVSRTSLVRLLW